MLPCEFSKQESSIRHSQSNEVVSRGSLSQSLGAEKHGKAQGVTQKAHR